MSPHGYHLLAGSRLSLIIYHLLLPGLKGLWIYHYGLWIINMVMVMVICYAGKEDFVFGSMIPRHCLGGIVLTVRGLY